MRAHERFRVITKRGGQCRHIARIATIAHGHGGVAREACSLGARDGGATKACAKSVGVERKQFGGLGRCSRAMWRHGWERGVA